MTRAVFNHYDNSGVSYYRMWGQEKHLKKMGWDTFRFDNTKPFMEVSDWEAILPGTDIFINQQHDNPSFLALTMAMRDEYNMPIVAEIDDDIYDVNPSSPAYQYFYPGSPIIEMTEEYLKDADAITTTTQRLADVYSKLNKNIYILPNALDAEDWPDHTPRAGDPIIIGWAGSPTHFQDLRVVEKPLKKVLKKHPNVLFRVMGCLPDFFAGHSQIELREDYVDIMDWPQKLASLNFDIGIAPLAISNFNLAKSNLKWMEYSILNIPGVYSRVGEYARTIDDGLTGFLANDPREWEYHLTNLIESEDLRRRIGGQAKQKVIDEYTLSKTIGAWDAAYRDIIRNYKS